MLHEEPILAEQGHDVGHRTQADEVEETVFVSFRQTLAPGEGSHELEGHADAGEGLEGIGALRPPGVERGGRGQLLGRAVMVGDDDLNASSCARATWATALLPQSTVMSSLTPSAAALRTASSLTP